MAEIEFHEFNSREELAKALAKTIAGKLIPDIEIGQFASLALSGGSTPKLFLNQLGPMLGEMSEMIYFALVDERFVPIHDPRSNEGMIKKELGLDNHPSSEFLSLYAKNSKPEEVAKRAEARLLDDDELPFDVLVLGMGVDGHTASFFPGATNLTKACDPNAEVLFQAITEPTSNEPRITMTLPVIASAKYLVLHIEGSEKREVFEKAMADGDADELPIRHVLRHHDAKLQVYWAP
ncbi:MAG: 6-phosphogluconolactonase [Rhizobiaceae bacterium]